ncbi:L-serine ammonia-lyase [Arthrobacter sp. JZ12]|uniref:L-serine ammonia-lyase n=1 Tax=Arthrobacter sp. JZ12 TaxID=2654190 RepID=UPI002B46962B|nr:L-serine ammonia-lyase [Arthrobacter sp. JZ12]WRH26266.1 L-serine ammonia-lyase [Arthrobacter sp. JZ12]
MTISAFDLFKIGIGPSSSHTGGPMTAAYLFTQMLFQRGQLEQTREVKAELFGSLGVTGHGHGTVKAVILGLEGEQPHLTDPQRAEPRVEQISATKALRLGGTHEVFFDPQTDLILHRKERLEYHTNGMRFTAYAEDRMVLLSREYYSVGGGFVLDEDQIGTDTPAENSVDVPYPFTSAEQLLEIAATTGKSFADIVLANELATRNENDVRGGLLKIWDVMQDTIRRGTINSGELPGGLHVRRRAAKQFELLRKEADPNDHLSTMEWVTLFALAVNEENAAGGRVVTAPTNGAAGIIPAVLKYYTDFVPGADDDGVIRFLLTSTAVGALFKTNASISGAEVGCQGEVGSACAMAAAGLAEVLGGTPAQVENAAEIGIEHNLGLTCDPVGGLVQIPCIERNAVAAMKAITAARMAVRGDGQHFVSLDAAIKTMRETGADMMDKYKETARGGLALNVVEC